MPEISGNSFQTRQILKEINDQDNPIAASFTVFHSLEKLDLAYSGCTVMAVLAVRGHRLSIFVFFNGICPFRSDSPTPSPFNGHLSKLSLTGL